MKKASALCLVFALTTGAEAEWTTRAFSTGSMAITTATNYPIFTTGVLFDADNGCDPTIVFFQDYQALGDMDLRDGVHREDSTLELRVDRGDTYATKHPRLLTTNNIQLCLMKDSDGEMIPQLIQGSTLRIRYTLRGRHPLNIRFSLAGSQAAIIAAGRACYEKAQSHEDKETLRF